MIQMMDYYDYTPDKIADKIIRQSYDDNTTLDNFIININNDINPDPPKDSSKQMDNDDNPRPKAYGLYPMPEPRKAESKEHNAVGSNIKAGEVSSVGLEAPRKVSAAPSPPARAHACNVLMP